MARSCLSVSKHCIKFLLVIRYIIDGKIDSQVFQIEGTPGKNVWQLW